MYGARKQVGFVLSAPTGTHTPSRQLTLPLPCVGTSAGRGAQSMRLALRRCRCGVVAVETSKWGWPASTSLCAPAVHSLKGVEEEYHILALEGCQRDLLELVLFTLGQATQCQSRC